MGAEVTDQPERARIAVIEFEVQAGVLRAEARAIIEIVWAVGVMDQHAHPHLLGAYSLVGILHFTLTTTPSGFRMFVEPWTCCR